MKHNHLYFGDEEVKNCSMDKAGIVILPLPYEACSSYGKGSSKGPYHILDASYQLEIIDEETLINWGSLPIHTCLPLSLPSDPKQAVDRMEQAAYDILASEKFLLSLGGDHAISIGPIRAAAKIFSNIGVLQFDAHLDLRNEWNGSKYNHACVMRRVVDDMGLPIVQVGIRSFSPEELNLVQKRDYKPFYAHKINHLNNIWISEVIERLPENVYLTIDLDGLDPSVLPGTGTPEPGGLSYRQLINLIKAVGEKRKVVAADINELIPIKGSHVSEFIAAKIASKIFVYCFAKQKKHF
ncbi:Agmatinase 1 [Candidatus Magnetomoraceae bacterium gMMP-15]